MLVVQMLLPRFLVLEGLIVVFQSFVPDKASACLSRAGEGTGNRVMDHSEGDVPSSQSCAENLNEYDSLNLPLFVSPSNDDFVLPVSTSRGREDQRWLSFDDGEVFLVCPGARLKANGKLRGKLSCLSGGRYQLEGASSPSLVFADLGCSRSIRESVAPTDVPCGPSQKTGKLSDIGWRKQQGRDSFSSQITVCHDSADSNTYYVNHTVFGQAIEARNTEAGRPSYFKEGGFFDSVSADASYKLRMQEKTLTDLLGPVKAGQLFNKRTSFFAKGHLAPDADFIYKEWQDATYYFANVAPQWQAFNNGNWKAVEIAVRDRAGRTGSTFDVITGTLGQLEHVDDKGIVHKIFLGPDGHIPVPEFTWKIAYDRLADEAIVFVGLNNPHFEGNPAVEEQICPDICVSANWLFLYKDDVSRGFTYCCSYQDFKAAVDWIPDLGDPGILKNILSPE